MPHMLDFFDSNIFLGVNRSPYPHAFMDAKGLLQRMKRYGISKALVYHVVARDHNIIIGNNELFDEIKNHNSLYPIWLAMPHHTGEFHNPAELADKMKAAGVRAVRLFPEKGYQFFGPGHYFDLSLRNCGDLFSMLESYNVPVFIELECENVPWERISTVCLKYPKLKVILCGLDYSVDRNLYPILSECENVFVETYKYKGHYAIEGICEKFGAKRLIFGSGMPLFSGGAAVGMINYAHISSAEKEMIARLNLESMLEEVSL